MAANERDSGGICPDCGARPVPGANYCWLCGRLFTTSAAPEEIIVATAVYEKSDPQTSQSVLYLAVLFGFLALIGLLAAYWNDIRSDSLLRTTAIVVGAPALAITAAVIVLAGRRSQITVSRKTLALGAVVGAIGAVLVLLFATTAVVVASVIAFLVTCGTAGSLPP